jgi:hypothetical protein
VRRRWILIDCDPVRPSGISSTDAEHGAALARARTIRDALVADGWPSAGIVLADSGNGGHVLARVDLPNDKESFTLVQRALKALALFFDDERVKVDVSVANAGRITKLYGTLVRKGDNLPERPHRRSRLLEVPSPIVVVPRTCVEALAATLPKLPERLAPTTKASATSDLRGWISKHNVPVVREADWEKGHKYILNPCPWNPDHTNDSAFILQFDGGGIDAGCRHNGCADHDWHSLRDLYEPGWRERKQADPLWEDATDGVQPRYVLRSDLEIEQRQTPPALIDGLLPVAALAMVYGQPGGGKSFLALALALSVATGSPWQGRTVRRGTVLYIAAEGSGGLSVRLRAWKQAHGIAGETGLLFLTEAVPLMENDAVGRLLEAVREAGERPVLVIVDTLARCIVGGDENSAKDVGQAIANLDRIRRELNATVVVVHHTTKTGTSERGSSALRGAADTMIAVGRSADTLFLTCEKQKDAEPFPEIALKFEIRDLGNRDSSLILVPAAIRNPCGPTGNSLSVSERRCFDVLEHHPEGYGSVAWQRATGLPETSFRRARKGLLKKGRVLKITERARAHYVVAGAVAAEDFIPPTATSPPESAMAVSKTTATPPHTVGAAGVAVDGGDGEVERPHPHPLQSTNPGPHTGADNPSVAADAPGFSPNTEVSARRISPDDASIRDNDAKEESRSATTEPPRSAMPLPYAPGQGLLVEENGVQRRLTIEETLRKLVAMGEEDMARMFAEELGRPDLLPGAEGSLAA